MAVNEMVSLLTAMKNRLDSQLVSITPAVVIAIGPLKRRDWPKFSRYLIELRPGKVYREEQPSATQYMNFYPVTIVVFVRRFWDDYKSAYGTEAGEIGVVVLCEMVQEAINGVDLGPVWAIRAGGESQEVDAPLEDDEAGRYLETADLAVFYRVGIVNYLGHGKIRSIRT